MQVGSDLLSMLSALVNSGLFVNERITGINCTCRQP